VTPAHCRGCGQTWPRDPRLEVNCPRCGAAAGTSCRRPSGHAAAEIHVEREQLAIDRGFLSAPCPASPHPSPPDDQHAESPSSAGPRQASLWA
jgi:hypothetical protein